MIGRNLLRKIPRLADYQEAPRHRINLARV